MAWKRQRTRATAYVDADIDLDEFSEEQLLQALIDAGWITESEAEAIEKRHAAGEKKSIISDPMVEELEEARYCISKGWKGEALIHLERFLGRDFMGRLT